ADVPGRPDVAEAAPTAASGPGAGRVCAMAFGPGLTVETALMTRRTA
ncbi:type III polyketide synthase, partial [Clavibacter michiganensis]